MEKGKQKTDQRPGPDIESEEAARQFCGLQGLASWRKRLGLYLVYGGFEVPPFHSLPPQRSISEEPARRRPAGRQALRTCEVAEDFCVGCTTAAECDYFGGFRIRDAAADQLEQRGVADAKVSHIAE